MWCWKELYTKKIYQRVWDCIWDGSPRNTAESTGTFPPTPIDHTDAKKIRVVDESEAPATVEKRPIMRKVMLNEILIMQSDPDKKNNDEHTFSPTSQTLYPRKRRQ